MGCGTKEHPSSYDTPGWKLQNIDTIEKNKRGFNKITLKRKNNKLLQFCVVKKLFRIFFYKEFILQQTQCLKKIVHFCRIVYGTCTVAPTPYFKEGEGLGLYTFLRVTRYT